MSATDFLKMIPVESPTAALVKILADAGNVFSTGGAYTGSANHLWVLLSTAPGFTNRQRGEFARLVPDAHVLSTILCLCLEECDQLGLKDGNVPRVSLRREVSAKTWQIVGPARETTPAIRHFLRIVFDTAEDRAHFEGWLSAQISPTRCDAASRIRSITTEDRA